MDASLSFFCLVYCLVTFVVLTEIRLFNIRIY